MAVSAFDWLKIRYFIFELLWIICIFEIVKAEYITELAAFRARRSYKSKLECLFPTEYSGRCVTSSKSGRDICYPDLSLLDYSCVSKHQNGRHSVPPPRITHGQYKALITKFHQSTPVAGQRNGNGQNKPFLVVQYQCNQGYEFLDEAEFLFCRDYNWIQTTPICVPREFANDYREKGNPCQQNNGDCSHVCRHLGGGIITCECPNGMVLDAEDGRTCREIDLCQINNGGCSHLCMNADEPGGSPKCACPAEGKWSLLKDGKTCQEEDLDQPEDMVPDRPGVCPQVPFGHPDQKCASNCRRDYNCPGTEKCCNNGCADICMTPEPGSILKPTSECISLEKCQQCVIIDEIRHRCTCDTGEICYLTKSTPEVTITPVGPIEIRPGLSLNLTCNAVGFPSPNVTWWKDNILMAQQNEGSGDRTVQKHLLVKELFKSSIFTCEAVNEIGGNNADVKVIVTGPGSPPTNIQAKVNGTSVTIRWQAPTLPNGQLKGYHVYYIDVNPRRPLKDWTRLHVSETRILVQNLLPTTKYFFRILPYNERGSGIMTNIFSVKTEKLELKPTVTIVEGAVVEVEPGESVNLTCKADGHPPASVAWYQNGNRLQEAMVVPSLTTVYQNALENAVFECRASNGIGFANASVRVDVKGPGRAPGQIQYRVQGVDIEISWGAPQFPNGEIQGYTVYYTTEPNLPVDEWSVEMVLKQQSLTLKDLQPGTTYFGRIRAFNEKGPGPLSETFNMMTERRNVAPKVRILHMETPLRVEIAPFGQINLTCAGSGIPEPSVSWKQEGETLRSFQQQGPGENEISKVLVIDKIIENTAFTCEGTNDVGSDSTRVDVFVTGPGSPPENVEVSNDETTIQVKWQEPVITNGRISGYNIYFTTNRTLPLTAWQRFSVPSVGQQAQAVMHDLLEDTTYYIRVSGYTALGEGVVSPVYHSRTTKKSAAPKVVLQPEDTTVSIRPGESYVVTCSAEGHPAPDLAWYKDGQPVSYRILSDNAKVFAAVLTVENLLKTSVFTCRAINSLGTSTKEIIIEVKGPGSAPRNIRYMPYSTNIELLWELPEISNGQIIGYEIIYTTDSSQNLTDWYKVNIGPEFTHKLVGLKSTTAYTIRVRAVNQKGPGPWSPAFTVDTGDEEAPPIVVVLPKDPVYHVAPGGTVNLTCQSEGFPEPVVQWYEGGRPLEHGVGSEVTIVKQNVFESTMFECRATNVNGVASKKVTVEVDGPGESPIKFEVIAKGTTIEASWLPPRIVNGVLKSFAIYYTTNPNLEISQWETIQVAVKPPEASPFYDLVLSSLPPKTTYYLKIQAISDRGPGVMSDTLSATTVEQVPFLNVTIVPEGTVEVPLSGGIELICVANGYPTAMVTWRKIDHPFTGAQPNRNTIFIDGVSSAVTLECTAENEFGRAVSVAHIFPSEKLETVCKPKPKLINGNYFLTWLDMKETMKPGLTYVVLYTTQPDLPLHQWYNVETKDPSFVGLPGLQSGQKYSVRMKVVDPLDGRSQMVCGVYSNIVPTLPKVVTFIRAKNRTMLHWGTVEIPNEPLEKIFVHYTYEINLPFDEWDTAAAEPNAFEIFLPNIRSATDYVVKLEFITNKGDRHFSGQYEVTSPTFVPDECESFGCEHECEYDDDDEGIVTGCLCNVGFELDEDGKRCAIKAVAGKLPTPGFCDDNNGGCQQQCRTHKPGLVFCTCSPGYVLEKDGQSCKKESDSWEEDTTVETDTSKPDACALFGCQQGCFFDDEEETIVFACDCDPGFQLNPDGKTCSPFIPGTGKPPKTRTMLAGSCNKSNGGCQEVCKDVEPGFVECSCSQGFVVGDDRKSCVKTSFTSASPVSVTESVTGAPPSGACALFGCQQGCFFDDEEETIVFACDCDPGFQLNPDGKTCSPFIPGTGKPPKTRTMLAGSCNKSNGGCQEVCKDVKPGFVECSCSQGFIVGDDRKSCVKTSFTSAPPVSVTKSMTDAPSDACELYNCEHACVYEDETESKVVACDCLPGFILNEDGKTCAIFEPFEGGPSLKERKVSGLCSVNKGGCQQFCTQVEPNFVVCACAPDLNIGADNRSCVAEPSVVTDEPDVSPNDTVSDMCEMFGCEQACAYADDKKTIIIACDCNEGFQLNKDGKTCSLVGEPSVGETISGSCDSNNGGCDEFCTQVKPGFVACSCHPGSTIAIDRKSCVEKSDVIITSTEAVSAKKTTGITAAAQVSICRLPADPGPCDELNSLWYYDPTTDSCNQFTYGGCEGNENRFVSEMQCLDMCSDKACYQYRKEAIKKQAEYLPKCDKDGSFDALQCDPRGACWCVNPADGREVAGSRYVGRQNKPYCKSCIAEKNKQMTQPGSFIPSCTEDGLYSLVQCHGSTGHCWCVDQLTGEEIPNTKVPAGKRVSCAKPMDAMKPENFRVIITPEDKLKFNFVLKPKAVSKKFILYYTTEPDQPAESWQVLEIEEPFTDDGFETPNFLQPNQTYSFKITPVFEEGLGECSDVVIVSTTIKATPQMPTIRYENLKPTTVLIKWTRTTEMDKMHVTHYNVYINDHIIHNIHAHDEIPLVLEPGVHYIVYVKAVNEFGESPPSNSLDFVAPGGKESTEKPSIDDEKTISGEDIMILTKVPLKATTKPSDSSEAGDVTLKSSTSESTEIESTKDGDIIETTRAKAVVDGSKDITPKGDESVATTGKAVVGTTKEDEDGDTEEPDSPEETDEPPSITKVEGTTLKADVDIPESTEDEKETTASGVDKVKTTRKVSIGVSKERSAETDEPGSPEDTEEPPSITKVEATTLKVDVATPEDTDEDKETRAQDVDGKTTGKVSIAVTEEKSAETAEPDSAEGTKEPPSIAKSTAAQPDALTSEQPKEKTTAKEPLVTLPISLVPEKCHQMSKPADIVFMLDLTDQSRKDYRSALYQIATLVENFFVVSKESVHIGLVQYNETAKITINVGDYFNEQELVNTIKKASYVTGGTNTNFALSLTRTMLEYGRKNAAKIIIIITDGGDDIDESIHVAKLAVESGIKIIAIGIGPNVQREVIKEISSDLLGEQNDFYAKDIATLNNQVFQHVILRVCNVIGLADIEATTTDSVKVTSGESESSEKVSLGVKDVDGKTAGLEQTTAKEPLVTLPMSLVPEKCHQMSKPADIVFMLDLTNQSRTDYRSALYQIATVVENFFVVSTEAVHIGLVQYNETAKITINVGDYFNEQELVNTIKKASYVTGGTNTNFALSLTRTMLEYGRKNAAKIIIIITDGGDDIDESIHVAKLAVESGIKIIAIGIGPNVQREEIEEISSDLLGEPSDFYAKDIATLNNQVFQHVILRVCNVIGLADITATTSDSAKVTSGESESSEEVSSGVKDVDGKTAKLEKTTVSSVEDYTKDIPLNKTTEKSSEETTGSSESTDKSSSEEEATKEPGKVRNATLVELVDIRSTVRSDDDDRATEITDTPEVDGTGDVKPTPGDKISTAQVEGDDSKSSEEETATPEISGEAGVTSSDKIQSFKVTTASKFKSTLKPGDGDDSESSEEETATPEISGEAGVTSSDKIQSFKVTTASKFKSTLKPGDGDDSESSEEETATPEISGEAGVTSSDKIQSFKVTTASKFKSTLKPGDGDDSESSEEETATPEISGEAGVTSSDKIQSFKVTTASKFKSTLKPGDGDDSESSEEETATPEISGEAGVTSSDKIQSFKVTTASKFKSTLKPGDGDDSESSEKETATPEISGEADVTASDKVQSFKVTTAPMIKSTVKRGDGDDSESSEEETVTPEISGEADVSSSDKFQSFKPTNVPKFASTVKDVSTTESSEVSEAEETGVTAVGIDDETRQSTKVPDLDEPDVTAKGIDDSIHVTPTRKIRYPQKGTTVESEDFTPSAPGEDETEPGHVTEAATSEHFEIVSQTPGLDKDETLKPDSQLKPTTTLAPLSIPESCQQISGPADIVFILDLSDHLKPEDHKFTLMAITDIIGDHLIVASDAVRVAFIQYSNTVQVAVRLGDYANKDALVEAVNSLEHMRGGTVTGDALSEAKRILDQAGRPGVAQVVVIITDGFSQVDPRQAAEALLEDNVDIIAIGIGRGVDEVEIESISSKFLKEQGGFFAKDVLSLMKDQVLQHVVVRLCLYLQWYEKNQLPSIERTTPGDKSVTILSPDSAEISTSENVVTKVKGVEETTVSASDLFLPGAVYVDEIVCVADEDNEDKRKILIEWHVNEKETDDWTFVIEYSTALGDSRKTKRVAGKERIVILENLTPIAYKIRIHAMNGIGIGVVSEKVVDCEATESVSSPAAVPGTVDVTEKPDACDLYGCEHVCVWDSDYTVVACECEQGFQLNPDGKTCRSSQTGESRMIPGSCDKNNGGCQELCKNVERGFVECSCATPAFIIDYDNKSCVRKTDVLTTTDKLDLMKTTPKHDVIETTGEPDDVETVRPDLVEPEATTEKGDDEDETDKATKIAKITVTPATVPESAEDTDKVTKEPDDADDLTSPKDSSSSEGVDKTTNEKEKPEDPAELTTSLSEEEKTTEKVGQDITERAKVTESVDVGDPTKQSQEVTPDSEELSTTPNEGKVDVTDDSDVSSEESPKGDTTKKRATDKPVVVVTAATDGSVVDVTDDESSEEITAKGEGVTTTAEISEQKADKTTVERSDDNEEATTVAGGVDEPVTLPTVYELFTTSIPAKDIVVAPKCNCTCKILVKRKRGRCYYDDTDDENGSDEIEVIVGGGSRSSKEKDCNGTKVVIGGGGGKRRPPEIDHTPLEVPKDRESDCPCVEPLRGDVCPPGYSLKSGKCRDINECAYYNGNCSDGCVNTVGGYYCACPPGMQRDMADPKKCLDQDTFYKRLGQMLYHHLWNQAKQNKATVHPVDDHALELRYNQHPKNNNKATARVTNGTSSVKLEWEWSNFLKKLRKH